MEAWFAANLGDAMLAGDALDRVRTLFERGPARDDDSAVLMRHQSEGRLHCELWLYFPPELADLAGSIDARPCACPSADGLGILVGSPECLRRLRGNPRPAR